MKTSTILELTRRWTPKPLKEAVRLPLSWIGRHYMVPKGERFLNVVLGQLPDACSFVQIGSNDGKNGDPLHRFITTRPWSGLVVEPVPYLFDRLKATYAAKEGIISANVAIVSHPTESDFYFVREEANKILELPGWYDQIGSFSRDHIIKHFGEKIRPFIEARRVQQLRLDTLLKINNVIKLDLIHIDCEGYDYEILKSVDFAVWRPKVVIFEHKHLCSNDKRDAFELLSKSGYYGIVLDSDVVALDSGIWRQTTYFRRRYLSKRQSFHACDVPPSERADSRGAGASAVPL